MPAPVDLPRLFEGQRERGEGSNYAPFHYDKDRQVFVLDGYDIPLSELKPYRFTNYILASKGIDLPAQDHTDVEAAMKGIPAEELPNHALLAPVGTMSGLISGPKLPAWIQKNQGLAVIEAKAVIAESFSILEPSLVENLPSGSAGSMRFEAWLNEDTFTPKLQTLGSCACMGASFHSYIAHEGLEHGFSEYELHNNDIPAQTVSLYAGIGHLADLAEQDSE